MKDEGAALYQQAEEAYNANANRKALKLYKQAAAKGYVPAYRKVSHLYYYGKGNFAAEDKEAMEWMRRGAEAGDSAAMCELAEWFLGGRCGSYEFPKDRPQAFQWAQRAYETCQENNIDAGEAAFLLAKMYRNGHGTEKDIQKGISYRKQAAELGHVEAMRSLADMYRYGHSGVEKDIGQALALFKKAADKGDFASMEILGQLYDEGRDIAADKAKAAEWYEKAVATADADFLWLDGSMAACGNGTMQERKQKIMMRLGEMYANGIGVEQDEKKAEELRLRAAKEEKALRLSLKKVAGFAGVMIQELLYAGMQRLERKIFKTE